MLNMNIKNSAQKNKIALLTLGAVSLVLSRIVFSFINDPEGPNLLIVVGLAVIIFFLFLAIYVLCTRLVKLL